jgi:hypothetical protein
MTTTGLLEKLYNHAFDMVKFGETKNTVLIAFNGAIIVGMTKLANDTHNIYIYYYSLFILAMCGISVFICSSALIAKIKHKPHEISLPKNDNPLFFATVAHMTYEELLEKLRVEYGCTRENEHYERDLARQAIITSQIASRKFKLFNVAIGFTFCGITTPLSILIYKLFLDHDK